MLICLFRKMSLFYLAATLGLGQTAQAQWVESGSPNGPNDVQFWRDVEELPRSFTLLHQHFNFPEEPPIARQSTYGISVIGADTFDRPVKSWLYGSATGTVDITIYVALQYSDNHSSSSSAEKNNSAEIEEAYYGEPPLSALRRLDDSSPCPLAGTPKIWSTTEAEGPLSHADVGDSLFPFATGGSSTSTGIANVWRLRYRNVPRGRYAFYAASGDWTINGDGYEEGTNVVVANFSVENVQPAVQASMQILSPSPGAVLEAGKETTIRYRLAVSDHVLSFQRYSLVAGGRILTSRHYDWNSKTQLIEGSAVWTPTQPGTNIIQLFATDTICLSQANAVGLPEISVQVIGGHTEEPGALSITASIHDGDFHIAAATEQGQSYRLQRKYSLSTEEWLDLTESAQTAVVASTVWKLPQSHPSEFYRVVKDPASPTDNDWKTADFVFPAGTKVIKLHFTDPYTFRTNREVRLGIRGDTTGWGWGTWVYPNTSKALGLENPSFYLAGGSGIGVIPFTGLQALEPGKLHIAIFECESTKHPNTFGFLGFEGKMVIEEPTSLVRGSKDYYFKLGVRESKTITLAVAPE